ncbi:MAG: flavodoxin [Anaerolinea sp.]|nr:flavodoxin [Anaerolinea sp.]
MEKKVLVAFATTHGATQEVAEEVAAVLRDHGYEVEVQPARAVKSLAGCGAVVLGASLYMMHMHKDAARFLSRHKRAFNEGLPFAIFAGGPFDKADAAVWAEVRKRLDGDLANYPWLKPISTLVIGGKFDPTGLRFPWNLLPALKQMSSSDLRDWQAIRTWAGSLAEQMATGPLDLPTTIA